MRCGVQIQGSVASQNQNHWCASSGWIVDWEVASLLSVWLVRSYGITLRIFLSLCTNLQTSVTSSYYGAKVQKKLQVGLLPACDPILSMGDSPIYSYRKFGACDLHFLLQGFLNPPPSLRSTRTSRRPRWRKRPRAFAPTGWWSKLCRAISSIPCKVGTGNMETSAKKQGEFDEFRDS